MSLLVFKKNIDTLKTKGKYKSIKDPGRMRVLILDETSDVL